MDLHGGYARNLRISCETFAAAHPGPIDQISVRDIETWLASKNVGTRRRDNILSEIRHLFTFVRARGYLPAGDIVAAHVPTMHKLDGNIEIFTIPEIRLMLEHVERIWLPYLATAVFSGVRAEELFLGSDSAKSKDPLRWEDFDWQDMEICIRA